MEGGVRRGEGEGGGVDAAGSLNVGLVVWCGGD